MVERMGAFINPEITGGVDLIRTLACTADVHERNASPRHRNHYAIITNLTAAYFCGTGETAECVIRRGMPLEKNYEITEEERRSGNKQDFSRRDEWRRNLHSSENCTRI